METLTLLKALGDPIRLRIVAILRIEPLSVSEVCQILELKQSRISRHLGILSSAGILQHQRSGVHIYYGMSLLMQTIPSLQEMLKVFGLAEQSGLLGAPLEIENDRLHLQAYLKQRQTASIAFFEKAAMSKLDDQEAWVDSKFYMTEIQAQIATNLTQGADLGCGQGELAAYLVPKLDRLICVDQSSEMLDRAEKSISDKKADFRLGRLTHLPIKENEVDLVVLSMALHHVPDPLPVFQELRRVIQPGGCLLLVELLEHTEEVMRKSFADFWLGFPEEQLEQWLKISGFKIQKKIKGKGQGKLESILLKTKAA